MAYPDYSGWQFESDVLFAPQEETPDVNFDFDALANDSMYQSDSHDLGADTNMRLAAQLYTAATTPAAGGTVEFWASFGSGAAAGFAWDLSGSNGSYTLDSDHMGPPSGSLIVRNVSTVQYSPIFFLPVLGRYIAFAIKNNLGTGLSTTTSHHGIILRKFSFKHDDTAL